MAIKESKPEENKNKKKKTKSNKSKLRRKVGVCVPSHIKSFILSSFK